MYADNKVQLINICPRTNINMNLNAEKQIKECLENEWQNFADKLMTVTKNDSIDYYLSVKIDKVGYILKIFTTELLYPEEKISKDNYNNKKEELLQALKSIDPVIYPANKRTIEELFADAIIFIGRCFFRFFDLLWHGCRLELTKYYQTEIQVENLILNTSSENFIFKTKTQRQEIDRFITNQYFLNYTSKLRFFELAKKYVPRDLDAIQQRIEKNFSDLEKLLYGEEYVLK